MEAAHIPWRPLGELLVEHGVLTHAELERALAEQQRTGKKLGEIILELGFASGPAVTRALAQQWGLDVANESRFGTGLWSEIERRHREEGRHETDSDSDSDEPAREHLVIEFPGGVVHSVRPEQGERGELEERLEERTRQVSELEQELTETRGELEQLRSRLDDTAEPEPEPAPTAHVLFLATPSGYELQERDGAPPQAGERVEVEDGDVQLVAKVARSPLPGDRRPCAYLEPVPPPSPDE